MFIDCFIAILSVDLVLREPNGCNAYTYSWQIDFIIIYKYINIYVLYKYINNFIILYNEHAFSCRRPTYTAKTSCN